MKLFVTRGLGEGPTELAAFDMALYKAGIGNHNLMKYSSIIPPGSELIFSKFDINQLDKGSRLYVVMSDAYQTVKGEPACAGIGWVQDETGFGLLAEQHGPVSESVIQDKLKRTLESMISYRPEKFKGINHHIAHAVCEDKPVCALVAVTFAIYPAANSKIEELLSKY